MVKEDNFIIVIHVDYIIMQKKTKQGIIKNALFVFNIVALIVMNQDIVILE